MLHVSFCAQSIIQQIECLILILYGCIIITRHVTFDENTVPARKLQRRHFQPRSECSDIVSENETPSDELASVDSPQSLSDPQSSDGDTHDSNEVNNSVGDHEDTTSSSTSSLDCNGNEDEGDQNISGDHEDEDVLPPNRRYSERQRKPFSSWLQHQ
jgi:hypothetical protein